MPVACNRLLILPPPLPLRHSSFPRPSVILPAVICPASDLPAAIRPAVRVSASVEPEVPPTEPEMPPMGLESLLKWILDVPCERIITQLTLIAICLEIFLKFTDIVKALFSFCCKIKTWLEIFVKFTDIVKDLYSFCCKVETWNDETRNKACVATVATVDAILFVGCFFGLTRAWRKEAEQEKVAQGGGVEEDREV